MQVFGPVCREVSSFNLDVITGYPTQFLEEIDI